jgi:hypothetical protein
MIIPTESELKTQSVLNNFLVRTIAPGWVFSDPGKETPTIMALIIKNTIPILSRKGNCG